jgi:hypothetical protein
LIIPILLSASLLVTQVKETVWWNTPGGKVIQHQDPAGTSCSLMLYNDAGSVVFEWADPGRVVVTAIDWNWQLPENWQMPVAMQLGDEWLSNGGDSAVIQAVGHGSAVSFAVTKPIDDLLSRADHVDIKTINAELSIKLNQAKTSVLLSRAHQCRGVIGR